MIDPVGHIEEKTDYAQCDLGKGNQRQTAWIPLAYAKVGAVIKIKVGDSWEDGWMIRAVHGKDGSDKLDLRESFRRRMKKNSSIARDSK